MKGQKLKILLTGASGFIGRHLAEAWTERFELSIPSHRELDLADLTSVKKYFDDQHFDCVVHAAAVGVNRKNNTPEAAMVNLRMFENLSLQDQHFDKFIFFGSGAEYDKSQNLSRVKESSFGQSVPADPYGLSKYIISRLIEGRPKFYNLRTFAVFGRYEDYETRFISNAICRYLLHRPIIISQDVRFDYFGVSNLVKVADYFITHNPKRQFFNVGCGKAITLTEICVRLEKLTGKKLDVTVKQPGLNREYSCDNSLLLSEIKGFNFSDLDQELEQLLVWYRENLREIDATKVMFDK